MLPNTNRTYERYWEQWISFLKSEVNGNDPFVRSAGEEEKASLVGIMKLLRHEQGLRDKQAISFTAALRLWFAQQGFCGLGIDCDGEGGMQAHACGAPGEEGQRASGPAASVKLPICGSILIDMKMRMWTGCGWTGADMRDRMTYIGCMWAFEVGARVSEYTTPEPRGTDHLIFIAVSPSGTMSLYGSELPGIGPADEGRVDLISWSVGPWR